MAEKCSKCGGYFVVVDDKVYTTPNAEAQEATSYVFWECRSVPCPNQEPSVWSDRVGPWMASFDASRIYPLDYRKEDVSINQIAHGLANLKRYGGQGRLDRHYSVAEHCVHLANWAYENNCGNPKISLAVLLHDAAEFIVQDMPSPVKSTMRLRQEISDSLYDVLEAKILGTILRRFGVWAAYQAYDEWIAAIDRRICMNERLHVFYVTEPWGSEEVKPLRGVDIKCWHPATAKEKFLDLFQLLHSEVVQKDSDNG